MFFVGSRLLRWGLAEAFCGLGNLLPSTFGPGFWGLALRLNPHHEIAASNRARTLLDRGHEEAWSAFQNLLRQLANPGDTSASDLHLSRTPGRVLRRLSARWLWGPSAADVESVHDSSLQRTCRSLARDFTMQWTANGDLEVASKALDAWRSVSGSTLEVAWAEAEIDWRRTEGAMSGLGKAAPLITAGRFVSPLDTLLWCERCLQTREIDLSERCLELARRWIPEEGTTWSLDARLAQVLGQLDRAKVSRERALFFDPQDVTTFLSHLDPEVAHRRSEGTLEISVPASIPLGHVADIKLRLQVPSPEDWRVYLLPPAGHGLRVPRAPESFESDGLRTTQIEGCRGDRVRGGPWPLVALAVDASGRFLEARTEISVVDKTPGRVLLAVTEDHEIQEERGHLPPSALQRLLVEKSRFAADLGYLWTHMVEVGSTLAMADWAAAQGGAWPELRREVRRHLAEEVRRGHDLQPHLHTFNDPAYPHFPYRADDGGWQPDLRFLLTGAELRGDWASVCPPPPGSEHELREGPTFLDRLDSVTRAVGQLEDVGRLGSPDFRPVLWRSGLLEYGESPADRAWSGVALRRAGLLADSDRNKPGSARAGAVPPAFFTDWEQPFEPRPGGPLLQLPIVANLEGDYLMGTRALERRLRACVDAVSHNGDPKPGTHFFTVLTHDKFINARRGREELRLEQGYGDWQTVRQHLDAWQRAGAEVVTAAEGVEAAIDDLTWLPVPWLDRETFVLAGNEICYRLRVLGKGLRVDPTHPQHLLISVPCSLRSQVRAVTLCVDSRSHDIDLEPGGGAFWWVRDRESPATVSLQLESTVGPHLIHLEALDGERWRLQLGAEEPYLDARVLLPWSLGLPAGANYRVFGASGDRAPGIRTLAEGLLLEGLCFPDRETEPRLDVELQLVREPAPDPRPAEKEEVAS